MITSPGMSVTGVGHIHRDATFKPVNNDGGFCSYSIQVLNDKKEHMIYFCSQWLPLNNRLTSLITVGKLVMIVGFWKVSWMKQPDGTSNTYNKIQVDRLMFLDYEEQEPVEKESQEELEKDEPW